MTPRILYVINSMEGGGAASPLPAIMSTLRSAGAEVKLIALLERNGKAITPIVDAGFPIDIREGGERDELAAIRWIKSHALSFGATHLWTSLTRATLLGQIVGQQLRLPVVSWQHNAFLKPWNERLLRARSNMSALWVADSDQVAHLTLRRLRVEPDRLVTWPIFHADRGAPKTVPWHRGDGLRLGSLGRLHPAKGYDILIDALAYLQAQGFVPPVPMQITLSGEGAERGALEAKLRDRRLTNVHLPGFAEDPKAFLADQHIYLQPSRREGFCIAAHEAMQARLPMLVADTGQMAMSVAEAGAGQVVPTEDPAALAQGIRDLVCEPDRLACLGRNAATYVNDRYDVARFEAIGRGIVARMSEFELVKRHEKTRRWRLPKRHPDVT